MARKKNYVYLIGGMEGVDTDRMKGWRQEATDALAAYEIDTLDPTRRASFHKDIDVRDVNQSRRIFKMDLQDIAHSTVVLADMRYSCAGKQWGSAMELMFAHTENKIIILLTDEDDPIHPFLESIYTEKYHTLEECVEAVENYFDV